MHTGSTGYYRAAAATRTLSTTTPASTSSASSSFVTRKYRTYTQSSRPAPAERHLSTSTSAALFRWILGARGQAAGVDPRSDAEGDAVRFKSARRMRRLGEVRSTGVSAKGDESYTGTTARESGRDIDVQRTGESGAAARFPQTNRTRTRRTQTGTADMYSNAQGYPRQSTTTMPHSGAGFESRMPGSTPSMAPTSSLLPPHYQQQQPAHGQQGQTPQLHINTISGSQPAYSPVSAHTNITTTTNPTPSTTINNTTTTTATATANQSQPHWSGMEGDPGAAHFDGSPVGWGRDSDAYPGQCQGQGRYSVPIPAFMSSLPVPMYSGMQMQMPLNTSPDSPWAPSMYMSPTIPNAHMLRNLQMYMHPRSYYPYSPGGSMNFSSSAWNHQPYTPTYPTSPALPYPQSPNAPPYSPAPEYASAQYYGGHARKQVYPPSQSPRSPTKFAEAQRQAKAPLSSQLRQAQHAKDESKPDKKKKKRKGADAPKLPPYSYTDRCPKTRVLYARDAAEADKAIDDLRAALRTDPLHNQIIGFDLEWKPRFRKGEPENPVALVQLASREVIVLAQVTAMSHFPHKLQEILEDSSIYKAGVSISLDCKKLSKDYGISVRSCIELSFFAKCIDRQRWKGSFNQMIGLSRLVQAYLLNSLPKGSVQVSNWESNLSKQQQKYAANDAHCGLMVFHSLLAIANKMESDVLPDPSYYSFDVIDQRVVNVNGDTWLPCSPYPDHFDDEDSLSDSDNVPSAPELDAASEQLLLALEAGLRLP